MLSSVDLVPTISRYFTGVSDWFMATVTMEPSSFLNDVQESWLRLVTLPMRFAFGRINFEKCPR
jgi:hypothetical protein